MLVEVVAVLLEVEPQVLEVPVVEVLVQNLVL
jgi:hypothetical protein